MPFKHIFRVEAKWDPNQNNLLETPKIYQKTHTIEVEGKPLLSISAAKAFKGDPALYNPEDLLLSSLASCHLMSYLYVCFQNKIEVLAYSDKAEGLLELNSDGSGHFVEVRLNPNVTIANPNQIPLALELHKKANQLCFIANSCNFPVLHKATCNVI